MTEAERRKDVAATIALWISNGVSVREAADALGEEGVASWSRVRDLMLCHARAFERRHRLRTFPFDRDKFKALVHYVIWRAGDRDGFGAVKLNKVLWFSDARAYMLRGRPITGATYIREKWGPVPRPMMPVREELVREGSIRVWNEHVYGQNAPPSTRFHAVSPPPNATTIFDSEDLKTIDFWIETIDKKHTAGSISDESHDYAWEIAEMGEPLPYHAIFATRMRQPDDEELKWAEDRAKELGR